MYFWNAPIKSESNFWFLDSIAQSRTLPYPAFQILAYKYVRTR